MRELALSPVAAAVAAALPLIIDAALKGAIVLGIAGLLATLLRRRAASTRHAVWTAALLAQLAIPVLTLVLPRWRVPLDAAPAWLISATSATSSAAPTLDASVANLGEATRRFDGRRQEAQAKLERLRESTERAGQAIGAGAPPRQQDAPATSESRNHSAAAVITATSEARVAQPTAQSSKPEASKLALLWLAGALVVLVRLGAGTFAVSRLARRGEHVFDGSWLSLTQRLAGVLHIRRPLTLLRGGPLGVPVTWGVVYPVVLLPAEADEWPEERRRYVLVHEMAHVRRLDALTQLVAQIAVALFWFDPLVWLAARRMRAEREHACDDYVLRHGTTPSTYASDLLDMVRALGRESRQAQPAFAALAMARRSEFEGRMLSILDPHQERHPLRRGGSLAIAALALFLVLPLAALTPVRGAAAATSPVASDATSRGVRQPAVGAANAERSTASLPALSSAPSLPSQPPVAPAAPAAPRAGSSSMFGSMFGSPAVASTPAASPAPATSVTLVKRLVGYDCGKQNLRGGGTNLVHVHDDVGDDKSRVTEYMAVVPGRCTQATLTGRVTLSADDRDVVRMTSGSYLYLRERIPSVDRAVTVTPDAAGVPQFRYTRNGAAAAYDDDARGWAGGMLAEVAREIGINVEARVARLRRQGGVDAVLDAVRRTSSSSAKTGQLAALIQQGNLSDDELARIVDAGAREVKSSGDFSDLLRRVPARVAQSAAGRRALVDAIDGIPSSGDKTLVATQYAMQADRELLLALADVVERVPSSGDRASYLSATRARYLTPHDDRLRNAFFATLATMPSSGDRAATLLDALKFAAGDREVTRAVIRAVRELPSSGDQAAVLLAVTKQKLLLPELREDFFKSASLIGSATDYRAVMESAVP